MLTAAVSVPVFAALPRLASPSAGKATTDEELEEMLESGNAAVFTAGVRGDVPSPKAREALFWPLFTLTFQLFFFFQRNI